MRELLAELAQTLNRGRDCVYCGLVETRGSTPQKAGAAMLVFPDGSQCGTLGGGCVEAEVKQRALRVLNDGTGHAQLLTFNLDDDYGWDDGLICGGRMTILADPLLQQTASRPDTTSTTAYYQRYQQLVEAGHGCTEAVVLTPDHGVPVGSRYLFGPDNLPVCQTSAGPIPALVAQLLVPILQRPKPAVHKGISYLPILPRITLLIVGGGHVGQAVARLASDVDFEVWVLDDRERYANRERFPTACRILVGDIGTLLKDLARTLTPSFYSIIVTRGHSHDEEALYHLAPTAASYVGMIGSKRKIKLIFDDLLVKNIPEEVLARVHAPLGLEIGSQTVPEIAISIVAELIAHRNTGSVEQVHPKQSLLRQMNRR